MPVAVECPGCWPKQGLTHGKRLTTCGVGFCVSSSLRWLELIRACGISGTAGSPATAAVASPASDAALESADLLSQILYETLLLPLHNITHESTASTSQVLKSVAAAAMRPPPATCMLSRLVTIARARNLAMNSVQARVRESPLHLITT